MRLTDMWSIAWRAILALVVLLAGGLGAFLAGLGAQPLSWFLAPASLAAVAIVTAWVLWFGRSSSERVLAALGAAGVAMILGVLVWAASPVGHQVLARELEAIELPAGAELVEQHESGGVLCFDSCPTLSRTYLLEGDPQEVADRMTHHLRTSRFDIARSGPDGTFFSNGSDEDIHLTVDVAPAYRHPATERHPHPDRLPGMTRITITAIGQQPF